MIPQHNTGLINNFSENIWLGGTIPDVVINESGDWLDYDVTHEKQKDPIETMACVTFSLNNNLEIQHNFKGIDLNLSDRFSAKMNDTQMNGNTFERVADAARKIGVVPESLYPNSPKAQTWAEYYRAISQEIINKAVKVDFNYEIIARTNDFEAQLQKYLKQCPLWITIYSPNPNHAVTLLKVSNGKAWIKDHYSQSIKTIKVSDIAIAARVVLNNLINFNMNEFVKTINNKGQVGIVVFADTVENYKFLCKSYGVEPKVNTDGTINTDLTI